MAGSRPTAGFPQIFLESRHVAAASAQACRAAQERQIAYLTQYGEGKDGAVEWNRTTDPVLTKDVLCP